MNLLIRPSSVEQALLVALARKQQELISSVCIRILG